MSAIKLKQDISQDYHVNSKVLLWGPNQMTRFAWDWVRVSWSRWLCKFQGQVMRPESNGSVCMKPGKDVMLWTIVLNPRFIAEVTSDGRILNGGSMFKDWNGTCSGEQILSLSNECWIMIDSFPLLFLSIFLSLCNLWALDLVNQQLVVLIICAGWCRIFINWVMS